MRIVTSFLTPTRPVAQCGLKLIFVLSPSWFGIWDCCSSFHRHAISYTKDDLRYTGRHRKSEHPNKKAQQTNPFVHHSWFGHTAHPAGTVSQTGSWNTITCFCTVFQKLISWHFTIVVPIFEVARSQATRRCQGKQWWSLAWKPAPSLRSQCCIQTHGQCNCKPNHPQ